MLGRETYRSMRDLPDAPELVVVSVPAAAFEQTVDDALAVGAPRVRRASPPGLGESGGEELKRERALVERVRAAGAMLLGPNCLGVYDAGGRARHLLQRVPAGRRSGSSRRAAIWRSRWASWRASTASASRASPRIGNQADVDLAELIAAFAASTRRPR